jgi:ribonuclease Z
MRFQRKTPTRVATGGLAIGLVAGLALMADSPWVSTAYAEEATELSPTKTRPRDTYYPNTEDLAPDEMRVIACGTGMPTTRMKQAAACFLVELGNGDKFLFDAGSGSAERISALQIPYNYLDKIFIGHLHSDHFGAVPEYWIGGALMGRNQPLRIWGPSGRIPELGTAAAMEAMQKMFLWDITGRVGDVDPRGYKLEVNEFDYKGKTRSSTTRTAS